MSRENAKAKALLEAEYIDTFEATDQLTNAMYKRASEFPIASREDAIDALMDAAVGTATLAGALLALTGTRDEAASDALLKASKEAGNANMQTLRAIGYLNKCQAEKDTAMDGRIQAKAQAMGVACNGIVAEAREAADNYARMEYAEPSRPRVCWGMCMPDIDEPTGAALHLLGAVAKLDYYRLATEGTAISGGIEGAMDHIESAVDILWPETDEATGGEDLSGIPYVEVGYADGSSMRTVGHFDRHTVADVARLITLTTAPIEEEEV